LPLHRSECGFGRGLDVDEGIASGVCVSALVFFRKRLGFDALATWVVVVVSQMNNQIVVVLTKHGGDNAIFVGMHTFR